MLSARRGTSVLETLIASFIMGLVVLGLAQAFGFLKVRSLGLLQNMAEDRTFRGFSDHFVRVIESADVSQHFFSVPVPIAYDANGPSVKLLSGQNFVDPGTLTSGFFVAPQGGINSGVEFFEDRSTFLDFEFKPLGRYIAATGQARVLQKADYSLPHPPESDYAIPGFVKNNELYATWPLIDENSLGFPILTRAQNDAHFRLEQVYTKLTLPTAAGDFAIFHGSAQDINPDQLIGKLAVIYNAFSPDEFLINTITDAFNCMGSARCETIAESLAPKTGPAGGQLPVSISGGRVYAVELRPVTEAEYNTAGFYPNISTGLSWYPIGAPIKAFPTRIPSLNDQLLGSPDPTNVHRWTKFYHSRHEDVELMMIPVDSFLYQIRVDGRGATAKRRLIKRTFNSVTPVGDEIVLDDVSENGRITFARRLGTTNVSVYYFDTE